MKWQKIKTLDEIKENENNIEIEDEIIDKLVSELKMRSFSIKIVSKGYKKGIDILAEKNGKWIFECKGTKTNQNDGNIFSRKQNTNHLGKAIVQCMKRYSKEREGKYFVVFPFHKDFKTEIENMGPLAKELPLKILFIGKNTIYEY